MPTLAPQNTQSPQSDSRSRQSEQNPQPPSQASLASEQSPSQDQQPDPGEEVAPAPDDAASDVAAQLLRDLGIAVADEGEAEPLPELVAEEKSEPESTTTQEEEEKTPKVKVKRPASPHLEDIVRRVINEQRVAEGGTPSPPAVASPTPTAPATAGAAAAPTGQQQPAQTVPTQPVDDAHKDWLPNELEELALAKYAEESDPRYAGQVAKVEKYRAELRAYIERALKEDPSRTLDEDDIEFQEWRREHEPSYAPGDRRRFEKSLLVKQAAEEAKRAAEREVAAKLEQRMRALELAPVIQSEVGYLDSLLLTPSAAGDKKDDPVEELLQGLQEHGYAAMSEADPIRVSIAAAEYGAARAEAQAFLAVSHGLIPFNPNDANHARIASFLAEQERIFVEKGGKARQRNGAWFIPRAAFVQLAEQRGLNPDGTVTDAKGVRYYTWSNADVLRLRAAHARRAVSRRIRETEQSLAKSGWERKPREIKAKADETQPTTPRTLRTATPSIQPSPSPGIKGARSQDADYLVKGLGLG